MLAAETPTWVLVAAPLLSTIAGGVIAALAGARVARWQIEAAADDREASRLFGGLDALQDVADQLNEISAKRLDQRTAGGVLTRDPRRLVLHARGDALADRIGDADLVSVWRDWRLALQDWADEGPPDSQQMAAANRKLNARLGELYRS